MRPVLVALGTAIRRCRGEVGLSQEEIAHRARVDRSDRSYMSSIERGEQNAGIVLIARIGQALGVSVAILMLDAQL